MLLLLLVAWPTWAATVSVSANVTELEEQQTTRVTVVVTGEQRVVTPEFPPVNNLTVRFAERTSRFESSPQLGIVRTIAFSYQVTPTAPGTFVLPPATVKLPNGDTLQTTPLTFTAKPRGTMEIPEDPLTATAAFNTTSAWEGEVVVYEAELTARARIGNVSWQMPSFKGLRRPANGDMVSSTSQIGDPRGDITIVKSQLPLVASGTGDRGQPPARARVDVLLDQRTLWGRSRKTYTVPTEAEAPLTIRPLPSAPDGFSQLVGEFELKSKLEKNTAGVGETISWSVLIVGDGVVDGFDLEDVKFPGARVYRDKAEVAGRLKDDQYLSSKTFRLQLVPTEPGVLDLPPLEVVTFSPSKGKFVTLRADVGRLTVTGERPDDEIKSFSSDDAITEATPVELVDVYTFGFATIPPLAPVLPLFLVLVSFPAGMLLTGEMAAAARRRWKERKARRTTEVRGRVRLSQLPDSGPERLALLDLALREALADHLKIPVGSLRRSEHLPQLVDDLRDRVENALQSLDRCRFAGESPDAELTAMVTDAVARLS